MTVWQLGVFYLENDADEDDNGDGDGDKPKAQRSLKGSPASGNF